MKKPGHSQKTYFSDDFDKTPQRLLFERLANKWYLAIIYDLNSGAGRFNQILKRNDGISQKMLSRTLKNLEEDGMVSRTVYGQKMPVEVVYSITDFGASLIKILDPLIIWSGENVSRVKKYRKEYVNKYGDNESFHLK
ncbi:winged helix-turn-helix transcriptional regulator [Pantoea ananatis]|uniref:winged helix-turn-helix transcriptional regulator n=1 Tax=Pantoea ananas TaxID=553 RepID=UPI001EE5419D|nr:helix-turn-helix domain-containing protein [Pantoea ananatis]MDI6539737.1 helix-turn-helix domain-containing protein [Pantoea ananatis]PKC45552.1 HxlR family transcriptional regulator [Pantoea ananatis BRT98]